jgi:hypothetical protein
MEMKMINIFMIMEDQCSVTNYLSFKNHLICKYINILTLF